MRGIEIAPRENEPSKERAKIQAVTVVPIFAPIITPMAFARAIKPAFTKLTSIKVVAVEDCTRAVTSMPVRTHFIFVEVIREMKDLRESPASFCKPPLMRDIP